MWTVGAQGTQNPRVALLTLEEADASGMALLPRGLVAARPLQAFILALEA